MKITLYEWMEDFDNSELNDYDRDEQLSESVTQYNEEQNTDHDKRKSLTGYKRWRKEKLMGDK